LNPPAILFAKAGANIIISARRPEKLSEVRQAAQQAHKEGGTGQGGKVFEWVQDVQDRRGVDSEPPFSP
jgi:3-hydroxy acid dehydrogenase/malonic semialdehyde reductase